MIKLLVIVVDVFLILKWLTLPATLMDEVKDAVEQEEDSGMNQLFI